MCTGHYVGDQCNFACHVGFHLNGNSLRTCQNTGTWSGPETLCTQGKYMRACKAYIVISNPSLEDMLPYSCKAIYFEKIVGRKVNKFNLTWDILQCLSYV